MAIPKFPYLSYGLIENLTDNQSNPGLPILLNENLKLKKDISKDQRIGLEDVEFNADDKAFKLYFQAIGRDVIPETIKANSAGSNLQYA